MIINYYESARIPGKMNIIMNKREEGKKNRLDGAAFERKTRKKLESDGFIIDKWSNNVDLDNECFKIAGNHYIPGRGSMPGLGFPDFVAILPKNKTKEIFRNYSVLFVECKSNNILSKIEKQKLQWMMEQGHICWIAYKGARNEVSLRKFEGYKPKK